MILRHLLPAALVALATAPALADPWPICDHGQPRTACVVDGDTVWHQGTKIRVLTLSAPEIDHARCPAERAAGIRARDRLAELLGAGPVTVVTAGRRDVYGRLLADLATPAGDPAATLVAEGLARPWTPGAKARAADRAAWCSD